MNLITDYLSRIMVYVQFVTCFLYRASDGVFETDVPVQVNVQDASDEVPVITMVTAATMSEEQAFGTGVYGGYVVTDGDDGDTLAYSVSGRKALWHVQKLYIYLS